MTRLFMVWDRLSETDRKVWQMTVWSMIFYLLHFDLYTLWYVEDAAISFAFARNIASGEGFVGFPGGETVEGFSNPSWTLTLAGLQLLGLTPFASAKLLGALSGLVVLPLAALWARATQPRPTWVAGLAPVFLAVSPQFVTWNASGLENAYFALFLSTGSVCLLQQLREPTRLPLSGVVWALLAITRPEGLAYVLIGLGIGSFWMLMNHSPRRFARWLLAVGLSLAIPLILWHLWRFHVFSWELPNTYYAKLGESRFEILEWKKRGWQYIRNFGLVSAHAFLIPLYVLGQTGIKGRGGLIGLGLCTTAYLLTLPGITWLFKLFEWVNLGWEDPEWLMLPRVVCWALVLFIPPALGLNRPGAAPRTLAWGFVTGVLCYTLYVGGDWMAGFRWLSFLIVPLLVLLTDALETLHNALAERGVWIRRGVPVFSAAIPFIAGLAHTGNLIAIPETSPYDVRRRVLYVENVRQQLDLDHITQMEVDMGAHLWWGDAHYIDMAGLTDVPMGHHTWERAFTREYVYEEVNPEFAHVHGGWARKTKMRSHIEWRDYLEFPPYAPNVWNRHEGNFIRRDLVMRDEWPGTQNREVRFGKSVELVGWHAPSLPLTPGHELRITLGWRRGRTRVENFRAYLYLANDDYMLLHEVPPLYDWVAPQKWSRTEIATSQHHIDIPSDMPISRYDLGIFVISEKTNEVIAMTEAREPATGKAPRAARGEVRWPSAIGVVSPERRDQAAQKKMTQFMNQARQGHCNAAANYWKYARNYYPEQHPMRQQTTPESEALLAQCYAKQSMESDDLLEQESLLKTALRWDHNEAEVQRIAQETARTARETGDRLRQAGELDAAYNHWKLSLTANPNQSALRRRLEELRDERHQLAEEKKTQDDSTED